MATRRRSRRKTISGNLTDIQKRVRYLETRPSASRLASKAVATRNLALRAVEEDAVADNAIIRRSIAASAVGTGQIEQDAITNNLIASNAVNADSIEAGAVGAPELGSSAVTTEKIENDAVTNAKIATDAVNSDSILAGSVGNTELGGGITDDKISGMSSSKLIGNIQDNQIFGISGTKIIGGIDGALIVAESVTEAKIASLPTTKLTGTITNAQLAGDIQAIKIAGVSSSVLIGEVAAGNIPDLATSKITSGEFNLARIPLIPPSKMAGVTLLLTTASVSGIGISRTFSQAAGGTFRSLDITINAGTGSNQLAIGNHTHAAGTVGAHTHVFNAVQQSLLISGGQHGHVGANGTHTHGVTAITAGSVGAVQPSTIKVKEQISDFIIKDPKNILNLTMKKYKYKNSMRDIQNKVNREWMHGYIAEEVQELGVEEILSYDSNKEPSGIDYGLLSTLILELVKVQQTEIDSLKEEIQRLKEKI